MAGAT